MLSRKDERPPRKCVEPGLDLQYPRRPPGSGGHARVRIDLADEEAASLREVLEEYVSDLRMEIADTEEMGFRESLKDRETFLKDLCRRLGG